MKPQVSIICPIYNEVNFIDNLIESLILQTYGSQHFEILLIDGFSTDGTREKIKKYLKEYGFIKLLDNQKVITAAALNIGIKAASNSLIIRVDAHAIYPTNYIEELVIYSQKYNTDNVGGVCISMAPDNSVVSESIAKALSCSFGVGNSLFRIGLTEIKLVDTVPFGCFNRSLFDKIGYFDEELIRNEDDEFNARITKNGGRIYILPHLKIQYFVRNNLRKLSKMFFQYGLFKPIVNKKIGKLISFRLLFPPIFVLTFSLTLLFGFFNLKILICFKILSIIYLLFAIAFSLKISNNIFEMILLPVVFFIIHYSYGLGFLFGYFGFSLNKKNKISINR